MSLSAARNHSSGIRARQRAGKGLVLLLLLAGVSILLEGCTPNGPQVLHPSETSTALGASDRGPDDSEEMRENLLHFEQTALASILEAARQMAAQARDPEERQAALAWGDRVALQIDEYISRDDPVLGLLDAWSYTSCLSQMADPDDHRLFSAQSSRIALGAARPLAENLRQIAARHLPEEKFARLENSVRQYASANPIGGSIDEKGYARMSVTDRGAQALGFLVRTPLTPLTTIGRVGEGAASFSDIAEAAVRISQVAETLPWDLRIQIEELASELQLIDQLTSTREMMLDMNQTVRQLTTVLETYPQDIESATRGVLREASDSQPEWRETLAQSSTTLGEATKLADTLTSLTVALERTAVEVNKLVEPTRKDPTEQAQDSTPFDIKDYDQAAQSMTRTLEELRATVQDLRELLESQAIARTVDVATAGSERVLNNAEDATRRLAEHVLDRIILRLIELVAAILLLLVLYHAVIQLWLKPLARRRAGKG